MSKESVNTLYEVIQSIASNNGLKIEDLCTALKLSIEEIVKGVIPEPQPVPEPELKIWDGTQAEYDALPVKDSKILYLIHG